MHNFKVNAIKIPLKWTYLSCIHRIIYNIESLSTSLVISTEGEQCAIYSGQNHSICFITLNHDSGDEVIGL